MGFLGLDWLWDKIDLGKLWEQLKDVDWSDVTWEKALSFTVNVGGHIRTIYDLCNLCISSTETDPFKMVKCPEMYSTKWWTDPRNEVPIVPPIFNSEITDIYTKIQRTCKDAVEKNTRLNHAIFIGPIGTGKTTACQVIARNSNANYFLFPEPLFIALAQDPVKIATFFKSLCELSCPTILVIDNAKHLVLKYKDDPEVSRAFDAFLTYSEKKNKIMFLFNTKEEKGLDPNLLDRMTYKLKLGNPDSKTMKDILLAHARNIPGIKDLLNQDMANFLVNSKAFVGRSGRQVSDALDALSDTVRLGSVSTKEAIKDSIITYFKTHAETE